MVYLINHGLVNVFNRHALYKTLTTCAYMSTTERIWPDFTNL